ncbi:MAG: sodium:proton antiporter [Clostridia bacterium]|nr:sodium:proton antiporter [Clostridia bacterium]
MTVALWQSIPFACILLPLFGAAVCLALPRRLARLWATFLMAAVTCMSLVFLVYMIPFGKSYNYPMGHFPAPFGNELRAGTLEAVLGLLFAGLTLICTLGGSRDAEHDISEGRQGLYHVLLLLMEAAMMAQVYTNDLFTAYVFVEIMTIAGCGLIAVRSEPGRAIVSAMRYMIMNSIGSAMFLLGIILIYDLTGHLLMENLHDSVVQLQAGGQYSQPLTMVVALLCSGLAVKSALFPFHSWVPDAYSTATPASASLLASLVSKSYIIVMLKVVFRILGTDVINAARMDDVFFVFGAAGMLIGSAVAITVPDVRRLVAWSSVAQIGYIFLGLGLHAGDAAVWHILTHAAAKSILFLSLPSLIPAGSDGSLRDLRGAGYRAPLAGVAFTTGALSLIGIPLMGGFITKLTLAQAALGAGGAHMWISLAALVLSTVLNVGYMLRCVLVFYSHPEEDAVPAAAPVRRGFALASVLVVLIAANIALLVFAQPILTAIRSGFAMFD